MLNNKKLGTDFERKIVSKFASLGYWVHFLNPDSRGAQPFDVIAIKGNRILAIDCKTCKQKYFPISRLEDNQQFAFELIQRKTNAEAIIVIEHDDHIFVLPYDGIKMMGKIKLEEGLDYLYHDLEVMLNEA